MSLGNRVPKLDLCWYHWSPTTNRNSINRYGLKPGCLTVQDTGWRPPYVCFSDDPWLAWHLSGRMFPEIPSWDLWFVYVPGSDVSGWECIMDTFPDTGRHYVKEYRVYERVYKRDIKYLATRTNGTG